MTIPSDISQIGLRRKSSSALGLRLAGLGQTAGRIAWVLVTLASLISFAFSLYSLNIWDRVPADQQSRYFPGMSAQDVQVHTDYQNAVRQAGFSLPGYATLFTVARIAGGLALFLMGFLLIRRYSDHLMAVLMAILLSVFAAAGIWGNPLFSWAAAIAPWLTIPVNLLSWLLWCGVIVLYTFPDGRFTPGWTFWLAVLVLPISFFMAFSINFFLNPGTWPDPLPLLPNILFIGGGLFSLAWRTWRKTNADQKQRLRGYATGMILLLAVYFVDFFINQVFPLLSGQALLRGFRAGMIYVLRYEPVWYALEIIFAAGLAISIFRKKLLES